MAIALPLIAAYASGAAAAVIAGTATMAAYATVAGAVLATVGALDGNKDLQKLGAVLQIGGGLAGMASAGSSAAGSAAASDAAAADAAAGMSPEFGSEAAYNAGIAGESTAGAVGSAGVAGATGTSSAANGLDATTTTGMPDISAQPGSLAARAESVAGAGAQQGSMDAAGQYFWGDGTGAAVADPGAASAMQPGAAAPQSALANSAQGVDSGSFSEWLDKAMGKTGSALKTTSEWVNKNKGTADLALGAIQGMYGPQAQMAKMQQDQIDYQRGLMERARANLNAPISLRSLPSQQR